MAQPDQVAQAFATHYYQTFDTNVMGLSNLYVRLCGPEEFCFPDPLLGGDQCRAADG